ncbi:hypothetical protein ABKN59_003491 [Abortiporus biennis]
MLFSTLAKIFGTVFLVRCATAHPFDFHSGGSINGTSDINGTSGTNSSSFPLPPSSSPQFTFIFGGQIPGPPLAGIPSDFGPQSAVIPFTQGNFTDMNGDVVATVVDGVNHGIVAENGLSYSDGSLVVQWQDDQSYAYMEFFGLGDYTRRLMLYVHVETASNSSHADLNGKFLVGEFLYSPSVDGRVFALYEKNS